MGKKILCLSPVKCHHVVASAELAVRFCSVFRVLEGNKSHLGPVNFLVRSIPPLMEEGPMYIKHVSCVPNRH